MPPFIAPTEIFYNDEIARFLAIMTMTNPEFQEPCQVLRVMFHCMKGDKLEAFILSDIKNRLQTLLYQRPDYYEAIKVFRGYVGLQEAFRDYGQRRPELLPLAW